MPRYIPLLITHQLCAMGRDYLADRRFADSTSATQILLQAAEKSNDFV
jgi:hypothetical protein